MKYDGVLTINTSLHPKFWSGDVLKSDVMSKILRIAQDFFDDLELEGVDLEDITLTGSLANYNYTKFSDLDLHLLLDFAKVDENYELVREFFSAKSALWNKNHNIEIFDHDVELYVQDINEDHHSTGVFSIKNSKWIAQPLRVEPEVDAPMVKRKAKSFMDMIERAQDLFDDKKYEESHQFASDLFSKIKKFRKSGLEDEGQYSYENLVFKYLRNYEHIKQLYDLRTDSYDKMMSLGGEYHKKFKIFIDFDQEDEGKGFQQLKEIEKFQKRVKKRHKRAKKWLISLGKQKTGRVYPKKPNYKRGKSAAPGPPGFGGS